MSMKLFHDTKLMLIRNLQHTFRTPVFIFVSMFQPLMYLLLFMPLLNGLGTVPGIPAGKAVDEFIPGLLVLEALFGTAFVGFSLIDDIRSGVIERFLVTPVIAFINPFRQSSKRRGHPFASMHFDYFSCDSIRTECKRSWLSTLTVAICFSWDYNGFCFLWVCIDIQN